MKMNTAGLPATPVVGVARVLQAGDNYSGTYTLGPTRNSVRGLGFAAQALKRLASFYPKQPRPESRRRRRRPFGRAGC